MAVQSSFNLKGILDVVGGKAKTEIGLSAIVDGIEAKRSETLIPPNSAWVSIPLQFNSGVDEALIVHIYSASKLLLEISDTSSSSTVELGIKGHWFMTLNPGQGISGLRAKNLSTSVNVVLELTYGALQSADDEPDYWQE